MPSAIHQPFPVKPMPQPRPGVSSDTLVATWDLSQTEAEPATESFGIQNGAAADEAAFSNDARTLVAAKDYGPNGKFRCKWHMSPP